MTQAISTPPVVDRLTTKRHKLPPVTLWAAAGFVSLGLCLYVLIRWFASGQIERTPDGPTPLPHWMRICLVAEQVGLVAILLTCIYVFLIRPWRRTGQITFDGIMLFGFLSLYWQDPYANYLRQYFTYNTHMLQFGSWANLLPGYVAPNGRYLAEPLLWEFAMYAAFCMPPIVFCNYLMRKARARRPAISKAGLIAIAIGFFFVFDIIGEPLMMVQGLYSLPGSIQRVSLFAGHYYQLPIYEPVFIGIWCGTYACIRFFRNDHGEAFHEHGIDRIGGSERRRTLVRALAAIGILNVCWMVLFNLPIGLITRLANPSWPADVYNRSYLVDHLCGPDTGYSCTSPGTRLR